MGLSEKLNKAPVIIGMIIGVVLLLIVGLRYEMSSSNEQLDKPSVQQAFFTDDDGKTLFTDDASKLAPFDHNGKKAIEACCYTTDEGKTHYVAYLRYYTDSGKRALDAFRARKGSDPVALTQLMVAGQVVKRPSDKDWIPASDPKSRQITALTPPNGQQGAVALPYSP